ncbi:thiamine phosphate synthase [Tepidibacter hydrothermalis]|uniref:Thiamine-phosphate synthase n=1 Tax=Tepidibacter hydrothermalis TaxID=3036126 RepID=A0ABY8E9J3_9FIRM|nr:thiamine phosphate synthase [Tepidibacter hydrothermalis]WFD09587.1 thiamine phosphate synthase [Tepidibacter hydrothermalis]
MKEYGLYIVTDSKILEGRDFYKCIEDALKGGVKTVQLREKYATGAEFLEKAIKLRELTKKYNAMFIVNDRVDIAIISNADGVHVGQSDIPVSYVKSIVGKDMIVGLSVSNVEEAKIAKEHGADYIGVGAMFNTSTKLDAKSVSIETLKNIRSQVDIPIVAIGGLQLDNIDPIKKCDIQGYAVISAILGKDDINSECTKWISKIK